MSVYSDFRNAVRIGTEKVFTEAGYTNVPVIYSHQNGSEPSGPYVVVQIVSLNQVGRNETSMLTQLAATYGWGFGWSENFSESDARQQITIKALYEGVVQFTFVGSQAPDLAHDFQQNICNNIVITEAYQRNLVAPMRKTGVRRAPQKRDTQWVEFFNMDVTFSYAVRTTQDIDWVEHVTILDENSGEIITIPPIP